MTRSDVEQLTQEMLSRAGVDAATLRVQPLADRWVVSWHTAGHQIAVGVPDGPPDAIRAVLQSVVLRDISLTRRTSSRRHPRRFGIS